MSATPTEQDPQALAHQQEVAGLLPALAQLDATAKQLEHQAAHARHLVGAAGATLQEITGAEKGHRGDGGKGFAARGLDHATHTRSYAPSQPTDSGKDRDRDDDEIDL